MKTQKNRWGVNIQFLISEDEAKDESKAYIKLAQWLAEQLLPFSAYRYKFVSNDSDDAIHRIQMDMNTYEVVKSYLDISKFCKHAMGG